MSKKIKVFTTILMIIMILATLSNIVFGAGIISSLGGDQTGTVSNSQNVTNIGKQIIGVVQIIGIIAAIVVLLVLGIKYMMGSAQEKAEYKKTMIPYVIGALLIFAASTLVNILYSVFSNVSAA